MRSDAVDPALLKHHDAIGRGDTGKAVCNLDNGGVRRMTNMLQREPSQKPVFAGGRNRRAKHCVIVVRTEPTVSLGPAD